MKLAHLILPEAVIPDLRASDRDGVVREMVTVLLGSRIGEKAVATSVAEARIERERQSTTAFGKGVVVPHAKHAAIHGVIGALARSSRGVGFRALDREPVRLIVLLLSSPECHDEQLSALERLFRFLREENLRRFVMLAKDSSEIWSLIVEADETWGGG